MTANPYSGPDLIETTIVAAVASGIIVAFALAILWGAACYWWREISDYWRWVRLSRRVQVHSSYRYRRNTDAS